MKEFLTLQPKFAIVFIVIVSVAALLMIIKLMQTIGLEKVRSYVYHLFVEAEREFEHGKNEEKFDYVVWFAKNAIPAPFNLFITEKALRKVIQLWFDLCKDLLDDGKLNGSETGKESE